MSWDRDSYAPDGVLASGLRRVKAGGKIKWASQVWQHDELKGYDGIWVRVMTGDYWITYIEVYRHEPGMKLIAKIEIKKAV